MRGYVQRAGPFHRSTAPPERLFAPPRTVVPENLVGPSILEVDTTRAKTMGAGASTPRKAQLNGDADDSSTVRAILAELGGCGVPQMGIAAESLRLAVASDGPMRNQVRSHLEARRCAAGSAATAPATG